MGRAERSRYAARTIRSSVAKIVRAPTERITPRKRLDWPARRARRPSSSSNNTRDLHSSSRSEGSDRRAASRGSFLTVACMYATCPMKVTIRVERDAVRRAQKEHLSAPPACAGPDEQGNAAQKSPVHSRYIGFRRRVRRCGKCQTRCRLLEAPNSKREGSLEAALGSIT